MVCAEVLWFRCFSGVSGIVALLWLFMCCSGVAVLVISGIVFGP